MIGASLGRVTTPRRKPGTKPETFDCGSHGHLTLQQIAHFAGIGVNAARYRAVKLGLRGEAILRPTKHVRAPTDLKPRIKLTTLRVAVKLARAFPNEVPTPEQIMAVHPMCRTAANNYRSALAETQRELAA